MTKKIGLMALLMVALAVPAFAQTTFLTGTTSGAVASGTPVTCSYTTSGGSGPQFVGRTQTAFGNCNGTSAAENFSPDASVANGNVLIAMVQEYIGSGFSAATPPSGWTDIGSVTNGANQKLDEWVHTYSPSDTTPYVAGGDPNLCAVKVIVRDYNSATGVDHFNTGSATSSAGCTIAALSATSHANEVYVGDLASDASGAPGWANPSGWGNATSDTASWSTRDADFAIATSGTTPSSQAGSLNSGSGNNDCMGVTIY